MASIMKVAFGYETAGWNLSLYNQTDDLGALEARADTLIPVIMRCLGVGVRTDHILLSRVDRWRDRRPMGKNWLNTGAGFDVPDGQKNLKGVKPNLNHPPDPHWTGIIVNFRGTTDREKGRWYFRGIPDPVIEAPAGIKETGTWPKEFAKLKAQLEDANNGWSIKVTLGKNVWGLGFVVSIAKLDANIFGTVRITTREAHGIEAGHRIRLSGWDDRPAFNGTYDVISVPSTTTLHVQMINLDAEPNVENPAPDATIRRLETAFRQIKSCTLGKVITHLPAERYGRLRGRRRKRVVS